MGSTNWGINFLVEEAIIPEIVHLAEHCENFAIRGYGTSFQVHDEMSVILFLFASFCRPYKNGTRDRSIRA